MLWLRASAKTFQRSCSQSRFWCRRGEKKVHFGQVGLLALPSWVTAPVLEQWMQEARDFAAEWAELRPLHQNKLCGRCLRAPLQVCFNAYTVRDAFSCTRPVQQKCFGAVA